MEKMTYVKALEAAIDMFHQGGQVDAEDVAVVEKLEALKAQLAKKHNYKAGKPTKAQKENAELVEKMVAFVADHGPVTCADLEAEFGLSNQKVAALLNKAGKDKFVKVVEAKGKVKAQWDLAQSPNNLRW